jgi:hypothetical protein
MWMQGQGRLGFAYRQVMLLRSLIHPEKTDRFRPLAAIRHT